MWGILTYRVVSRAMEGYTGQTKSTRTFKEIGTNNNSWAKNTYTLARLCVTSYCEGIKHIFRKNRPKQKRELISNPTPV